jgi:hypothetical protein
MTRRRSLSKKRLGRMKGKEQRTLILLGAVVLLIVLVMIFKG